ncbi:hypothetical protein D9M69_547480 [compost metagenome]
MVVVVGQVAQYISLYFGLAGVTRSRYPFGFEAPEETLHRGVVPAIAATTHAVADSMPPEQLSKFLTAVVAALVGVKQHTARQPGSQAQLNEYLVHALELTGFLGGFEQAEHVSSIADFLG